MTDGSKSVRVETLKSRFQNSLQGLNLTSEARKEMRECPYMAVFRNPEFVILPPTSLGYRSKPISLAEKSRQLPRKPLNARNHRRNCNARPTVDLPIRVNALFRIERNKGYNRTLPEGP